MISIIVCSTQPNPIVDLENNIKETIGDTTYELIWIDNSTGQYNIYQAYEKGLALAKYEYLCFMHEDILFHTNNWGKLITEKLDSDNTAMLGVLGGYFLGKYSLSWINIGLEYAGNIIQGSKTFWKYKTIKTNNKNIAGTRVAVIDGVFMCLKKYLFEENLLKWDTQTYKGFHFYDLDMSMQVHMIGKEIHVVPELLIEHKSKGNRNHSFYENCLIFHKKWNSSLPIVMPDYHLDDSLQNEDLHILEKYCHVVEKADSIRRKFSFFLQLKQLIKK